VIRVALYTRFSSDLQNDKSIDDQIAFCREICAREQFAVTMMFEDRELSGSSAINRPGFQAMMQAANARLFEVIVAEDMDRIFRDQADYHAARKVLDFIGIGIHTATGRVGRFDGAMRAFFGEYQLENLALHVRRSLEGVIRDGRHAGGRAYGYAAIPGKPGELIIAENEAAVVRRIFADFIAGRTPRAIAAVLNADRIQAPRGARWNASTINGNNARGHGMLLNELYAGRIVWNKVRMVKDPATGKRVSRPNDAALYRHADAPQLRIVDDATWSAAQAVKARRSHIGAAKSRQPKRPLSGLLRCGSCGGGMTSIGNTRGTPRLQCSTFKESGACSNSRKVSRDAIERSVFAGLREELKQPAAIAEYVKTYNAERRRLAKGSGERMAKLGRRDAEIGRELERLVDAIAKGRGEVDALLARIDGLEKERREIKAQLALATAEAEVITLHPASIERYAADVAKLADLAAAPGGLVESAELLAVLRALVAQVIVHAEPNARGFAVEVKGRLSELTGTALFPSRSKGGVIDGSERGTHALPPSRPELLFSFRWTARAA
jgi:site-specific DNA recombinase